MYRPLMLTAVLAVCLPALGCRRERVTFLDSATIDRLAALDYPATAEYGPDLDIVVVGRRDTVYLTNRTAYRIEDVELWLNRQWVSEPPDIEVGAGVSLSLTRFINQYKEPYPVPGFLRPGDSFPVVLAELYDPETGLRNRLLVQKVEARTVGIEGQE